MNTQFDLGAMLSAPVMPNTVQQIPCDNLIPYHNHKFEMYTGERLEDMVASIKENGVLSPIIVQPCGDVYEILIGHNRWNASKLAGLATVPAIVKTGLSEDEAEIYVIESNVLQRGFDNLRISEQAAVIALRHSEMFSPGKRSDIQMELALLENPKAEVSDTATLNPMGSRLDTNDEVGKEYGVSKGSVVRLIRINKLIDELKEFVDSGEIAIRSGVELSFLSAEAQAIVAEQATDFKIDMKKAKALREAADSEGNIDTSVIVRIITGTADVKPKPKNVKISEDTFSRYFAVGTKPKEVAETVEKALAFYFASMGKEDL
jgi:ParB family chromosome partitioning protein